MFDRRQYRPVPLDTEDGAVRGGYDSYGGRRWWKSAATILLYTLGMFGAFALGKHSAAPRGGDDSSLPVPLRTVSRTFHFDALFGAPPSPETDAAWASLFPVQGGFFKHPEIAPERSAFSVFHTLHCVDGLRHGYYAIYDALVSGQAVNVSALPFHASPQHAEHCLDLLRQNIMCSPDLTVELVNEEAGGVTGFGTEHQCRDWNQLNAFMAQWEGWHHTPKQDHSADEAGHVFDHDGH